MSPVAGASDGSGGGGGLFDTLSGFRAAVLSILLSAVFLRPVGLIIGFLDWLVATATSTLEDVVKTSVGGLMAGVVRAFFGPNGWVPTVRESLVSIATSAGVASPIAAGLVNLVLIGIVVGGTYVLARAVAGYFSGGVLA